MRKHFFSVTRSAAKTAALTMERELDIILLGATGYTGRLCAEYMVSKLQSQIKWAIAGRSKDRLGALAGNLNKDEHCGPQPGELPRLYLKAYC